MRPHPVERARRPRPARPARSGPPLVRRAGLIAVLAAAGSLGCQKTLFPANEPRTQFEVYDALRSRFVPLEEPDVFGNPQPALRARLGRRD